MSSPFSGSARIVALLVLAALPAFAGPAMAQPTAGGALVELVPPGAVLADGTTPVQLSVLALDADGTPLQVLKAKVTTSDGRVGKVKSSAPGVYSFELVPPSLQADQDLQLVLTGRTTAKVPVTRTFHLPVQAPLPGSLVFEASPPVIPLGQGATSTLSLQLEPGADLDVEDLQLDAMAGSVANLTYLGGGRVTALYTAPAVNYPHIDIVTVVDQRDPEHLYAQLTLPLVGRADFPVTVAPGASVLLGVGDREFGPVLADAQGQAMVPLEVPPGTSKATVTTPQGVSEIDLGTPPFAQATFLPQYAGVPGLLGSTVPLRLVVATAAGQPDAEARPALQVSTGTVGEAVYEGGGIYRFDYSPPAVTTATSVGIIAVLPGQEDKFRPQASLLVVPAVADRLDLQLVEGQARMHAVTAAGLGLPGQTLTMGAVGATVKGAVRDLGDGLYAADVSGQDGPMELWADPACEPTGNPARDLLLLSSTDAIALEGWTSTILTVVALDGLGHPVAGVPVTLTRLSGDGSLPAAVTTGGCGVARVGYTAGSTPGLTVLKASAGDLSALAPILQGPAVVVDAIDLGASGSALQIEQRATWSQRFPVLRSGAEPTASVAVVAPTNPAPTPEVAPTPAPAAVSTEPVSTLDVVAQPATVAPGTQLTLIVTATDAAGLGVPGQQLDLLVSTGAPGELQDLGDGRYQVSLDVPKRQAEPVKITVSTADGETFRFLKVPVGAAVAAPTPAPEPVPALEPVPAPEPTPGFGDQGVTAAQPKPVREPRTPSDLAKRWLRLRATGGVGLYDFEYVVSDDPRTLLADGDPVPYERSLVLEGADRELVPGGEASRQALPEIDLRARGWAPSFAYVGADLRYRGHYLAVDTDAFAQYNEGPDLGYWDNFFTAAVQGRYYHDLGDTRVWAGAAVGTVTTAVPLPAHWSPDGGAPALWFFPWGFTSFYGGLRGGVETGFGLEFMAEAAIGTERWSGVFLQEQSYELSYEVVEHVTIDLVFDIQARYILVPLEDVEPYDPMVQIYDSRIGAKLGMGVAF